MKNIKYISFIAALLLSACNLLDPLKDDLDQVNSNVNESLTYTLTDDDFATIATRALFLDPTDTTNAQFLKNYKYFIRTTDPSKYIPMLMDVSYPGLGSGSTAKVAYPYNGSMPEDLLTYINVPVYNISPEDYAAVSEDAAAAGYFSPLYNPAKYLPNILESQLDTAASGDIYAVSYKYSDVTPKIDQSSYDINPVLEESFDLDLSNFKAINITGDQVWSWKSADDGAVVINGWVNKYFVNEDWLVSPAINLSGSSNTHLQLKHAIEYYEDDCIFVLVSTNFDGENVNAATWTEIAIPNYEGSDKNNYIESSVVDMSAFDGKKIYLAFKYVSTSSKAPYWGISKVKIGPYGYKITGDAPYSITDYYKYDGSDWEKLDNVYVLNKTDYETMEISNDYMSFTKSAMASDYLPKYLGPKYSFSPDGTQKIVVYNYYDGKEVLTLADLLTKANDVWVSSYDYVRYVTDPFASTADGWVFDPTVNFTMSSSDYQIIVDYVNATPELAAQNTSKYNNSEYYYGSSSYYVDFDCRAGNFNSAFATWQDAVIEAIGEGLLPNKYPNATTQYKGIDMYYIVHFKAYGSADTYYFVKFQCTKSAPNPEFTLIEGPNAE